MNEMTRFKNPARWSRFAAFLVPLGLILSIVYLFIGPDLHSFRIGRYVEFGDFANNALRIDDAKRFSEIYGNFSRFHFYHPGPAYWYLYGLGEYLFHDWTGLVSSVPYAHLLTGALFQVVCVVCSVLYLGRRVGALVVLPALAILILQWHFMIGAPTSIWPPHVLFGPMVLLIVFAAGLATGDDVALPVVIFAGSMLIHGHVAQPLLVIPLAGISMAAWVIQRRRTHFLGARPYVIGAIVLVVIFAFPIMIDLIKWKESNIAAILAHLKETKEHHTIQQAIGYFFSFVRYETGQEAREGLAGFRLMPYLVEHASDWLRLLLPVTATVYLLMGSRTTSYTRSFATLLVLATMLCVIWGVVQDGLMYDFNGNYFYAVIYLSYLTPVVVLGAVLKTQERRVRIEVGVAAALISVCALPYAYKPLFTVTAPAQPIDDGLKALLGDSRSVHLELNGNAWETGFGVIIALERLGIRFSCPLGYEFLCGERPPAALDANAPTLLLTAIPCEGDGFSVANVGYGVIYTCRKAKVAS